MHEKFNGVIDSLVELSEEIEWLREQYDSLDGNAFVYFSILKDIEKWMAETWDDMNVAYNQDNKNHSHPRWKLKKILEQFRISTSLQTSEDTAEAEG